jgi:hypothetical protein
MAPALPDRGSGLFPAAGSREAIQQAVPRWLKEEPRISTNQPRFVRLTEAGADELLLGTDPERRSAMVLSVSPLYQKVLFLRWGALIDRHGWESDREPRQRCGAQLTAEFCAPEPDASSADFLRGMAHELTISWKREKNPEAREGIARAMRGAGLRQLGTAGEQVTFAGRYHACTAPMFPGDPAFILEPGWMIHDGTGEYLLEKAIVAPV